MDAAMTPNNDAIDSSSVKPWLILGISALAAAGLFSLLLVASRTPGIQEWIPWIDFFHTALVVHVNLSVLIWFLGFSALMWCLCVKQANSLLQRLSWILALTGTLTIIIAPFLGAGKPLLNNYVPVLQHPIFYIGLALFGSGITLQALLLLFNPHQTRVPAIAPFAVALRLSAATTLGAIVTLGYTWSVLDSSLIPKLYFEVLFWGAGHILQFSHTLLMLVTWCLLARHGSQDTALSPRTTSVLASITILPVIMALPIYWQHAVDSAELRIAFTELMRFGGLASLPLALLALWKPRAIHFNAPDTASTVSLVALWCSVTLFACGGIIGFLIEGINVVIPAHYHGSIVGVTLAFMGLSYYLLPALGASPASPRWAIRQLITYASGQLMHIIGLAWSGGYGVQRKTAGSAQGLDQLPEIAGMALMGMGGLISIIGGLLFLLVMIQALRSRN